MSKLRLAINGYGRIGRCVHRIALASDDLEVVAINSSPRSGADLRAHLLKYDSVHGKINAEVTHDTDSITIDGQCVASLAGTPGEDFKWSDHGVDIVVEASGRWLTKETCQAHIDAGAKKVVITAPAKDDTPTFVIGVNDADYAGQDIVSNASCTTNCTAPVVKALHEKFGIKAAQLTTVHSVTGSQNILDNSGKDFRTARAYASSIIPTKTGVSSALRRVLPEIADRFSGMALRVPTLDVSLIDVVCQLEKSATAEEINAAFEETAEGAMKGVLGVCHEPLVSIDFVGESRSAVIDAPNTKVIGDNLVKILAWYDNEWGYSVRVTDLIRKVSTK